MRERYPGRGLRVGRNRLVASAPGRTTDRVVITNHPNGGPVFSGPQVRPWVCQETARDAQCNQPPRYELMYRSSVTGQLRPLTSISRTSEPGKAEPMFFLIASAVGSPISMP